jgi:hypothetical protein
MPKVILYRGVNASKVRGKVGIWWSTNPYYSYTFSNSGKNLYYIIMDREELNRRIKSGEVEDASLESEYENFLFKKIDPENYEIKHANQNQVRALLDESEKRAPKGKTNPFLPGGKLMYTPPNAIDIGKAIFGGG